jgi:23S rRNA (guanosine2251-2'-O)-methyltransferase
VAEKVFGIHTVSGLLQRDPEKVQALWVQRGGKEARLEQVLAAAHAAGVPVHRIERRALDGLAPGVRHQGVIAEYRGAGPRGEADLDALLDGLPGPPLLLVLDGVQDPHNLGACLRSAGAAGAHAVIAPRDRAAGLTPVVRKVASGAAESVPYFQVTNLARVLKELQTRGVWVAGATGEADASLFDTDLNGPLALVLGGEGKGLRRLTRERCDILVSIPMQGAVESLNVSVAAAVCLFEAVRQRGS